MRQTITSLPEDLAKLQQQLTEFAARIVFVRAYQSRCGLKLPSWQSVMASTKPPGESDRSENAPLLLPPQPLSDWSGLPPRRWPHVGSSRKDRRARYAWNCPRWKRPSCRI